MFTIPAGARRQRHHPHIVLTEDDADGKSPESRQMGLADGAGTGLEQAGNRSATRRELGRADLGPGLEEDPVAGGEGEGEGVDGVEGLLGAFLGEVPGDAGLEEEGALGIGVPLHAGVGLQGP